MCMHSCRLQSFWLLFCFGIRTRPARLIDNLTSVVVHIEWRGVHSAHCTLNIDVAGENEGKSIKFSAICCESHFDCERQFLGCALHLPSFKRINSCRLYAWQFPYCSVFALHCVGSLFEMLLLLLLMMMMMVFRCHYTEQSWLWRCVFLCTCIRSFFITIIIIIINILHCCLTLIKTWSLKM